MVIRISDNKKSMMNTLLGKNGNVNLILRLDILIQNLVMLMDLLFVKQTVTHKKILERLLFLGMVEITFDM